MEFSREKFDDKNAYLDQPKKDNRLSPDQFFHSVSPKNYDEVKKDFESKALQEALRYKFLGDYFQSRARENIFNEKLYNTLNHIEYLHKELFFIERKIYALSEIKDKDITIPPAKKEYDAGEEWKKLQEPKEVPIHRKIPLILPKDENVEKYIMILGKRKMIIFEEIKDMLEILGKNYPGEYKKYTDYKKQEEQENRTN